MSALKHEGSPAGELREKLSTLPGMAEPPAQPEAGACNKALVTTAFLVPLNNNAYSSLQYKEVDSFEEATSKATQVFSIS